MSRILMVQGTTSDAGKSMLVAGLCRWLKHQGVMIAPFKPQNMALNSAVTSDGGEIGRAQAVQAFACGLDPHTDMNPVLLKPNSDKSAQVIIQGHALSNMSAEDYHSYKRIANNAVMESFARLTSQYDAVIVEGAGSPAEINLRENDIANMGFAEAVDCPVILIADIDRGGVFAHIVGTLELLSDSERKRVCGFVINRFRGEMGLLQSGLDWLEKYTGKPVLGVLPYLHGLHLEAEDAISNSTRLTDSVENELKIVVPVTPRFSNHTDFDALRLHPQVSLQFVGVGERFPPSDLIIIGGSKSVRADLEWLKEQGWDRDIYRHLRYGGKLIGICGGMQMLGKIINDPLGIEGKAGSSNGLGLLDFVTTITAQKQLRNVYGYLTFNESNKVAKTKLCGYEIHAGVSIGGALAKSFAQLTNGADGAISDDNNIIATYIHGVFDESTALSALLNWAGIQKQVPFDYQGMREASINRLAEAIEQYLDINAIKKILNL